MGVRLAAVIIDAAILFVILCVGTAIAEFGYHEYGPDAGYSAPATVVLWICLSALIAYVPLCWRVARATVGQWAMGLKVIRASDGSTLDVGAVAIRYLVWSVCLLTVFIGVVAAGVAASRPDKRTWPDEACGSIVVRLI
jgi:uncharacterized RDD family membrane protein YckC